MIARKMRLFTGIDLPTDVRESLTELLARLRPTAALSWSPPSNLHITTKFIGEWPEPRLGEVTSALGSLPARDPIAIRIGNLGFFPNARSPRVFWAGIEAPPELAALARETDCALQTLGIVPEQRVYSPHLTLARIRERQPLESLQRAIAGLKSLEFGHFQADRFYLYQSRAGPRGSVYTKIAEVILAVGSAS